MGAGRTERSGASPPSDDEGAMAAIVAEAGTHRGLEDVIRWGMAQTPPALITDVVVQDEFTHDVVLTLGTVWLVYDTT